MKSQRECHVPVAAIVLAAGGSSRMGGTKQLLTIDGQPMVRKVAEAACETDLAQVIVVIGADATLVSQALSGLPANLVYNPGWRGGMSSSLRAGIEALRPEVQAALIVLGDQPALSTRLFEDIVQRYRATGAPVVAPFFRGKRGNPVLFDRSIFPELIAVQGDRGGREIITRYQAALERLEVDNPSPLLDVDTPEDLKKARNQLEEQRESRDHTHDR